MQSWPCSYRQSVIYEQMLLIYLGNNASIGKLQFTTVNDCIFMKRNISLMEKEKLLEAKHACEHSTLNFIAVAGMKYGTY